MTSGLVTLLEPTQLLLGNGGVLGPHIHSKGQFREFDQPMKDIFGLWEDIGVPGENSHMHEENMETPQRKISSRILTRTVSQ